MNYFEWRYTKRPGDVEPILSFLEITEGGSMAQFWAILRKTDYDMFTPVVLNKDRNHYLTIEESLTVEEAKEAVEKKLLDDGIIRDGDEVKDYTV